MDKSGYGKYILVPIDFAGHSIKAAYLAFELAELWGVEIVFLHTYDSEKEKNDAVRRTDKLKAFFNSDREQGKYASVVYSVVIKKGIPEAEIKRFLKSNPPRIMIMGTRASDQKDHDLIGSVTAEVLSFANVPMIVVPDTCAISSYESVKDICYATNFSPKDAFVFFDLMQRLRRYDFNVRFVHVLEHYESAAALQPNINAFQSFVDEHFPTIKKQYVMLPCEKDVTHTINKYVAENGLQILTVKMSSGKGIYSMFVASLAQKLVYSAKAPLLILPYLPEKISQPADTESKQRLLKLHRNASKINFWNRKRP